MEKGMVYRGIKKWGRRSGLTRGAFLPLMSLGGNKNGMLDHRDVEGALMQWLLLSLCR